MIDSKRPSEDFARGVIVLYQAAQLNRQAVLASLIPPKVMP